jgi:hypothetical protein
MKKALLSILIMVISNHFIYSQDWVLENIDPDTGDGAYEIDSGDLDGDGDIDIVMATYFYNGGSPTQDYIKWYKNDGTGNFTIESTVSSTILWVDGLIVADIDGQFGDDIVATSVSQNKLVYFLSDGSGGFGPEILVDSAIVGPGEVVAGDINGDTFTDLVVVSFDNNRTQWYSGDGNGNFTAQTDIENGTSNGPYYVDMADFDGDSDLDVVVGFANGSQPIEIYYNQYIESGNNIVSWVKDAVTVDTGSSFLFVVRFADVNNDGNMDVLKVDNVSGNVFWFDKIPNGTSTSHTISNSSIISRPGAVAVADLDGDSYNDVILTDSGSANNAIIWFKGDEDSDPSVTPQLIVDNNFQMFDVTVADFDDDNDLDIANVGRFNSSVNWIENNLTQLSVDENTINTLTIFPNPTQNILNFKGYISGPLHVTVYDMLGKQLLSKEINDNNILDVSELASGIYTIRVNDSSESFKFIKQ